VSADVQSHVKARISRAVDDIIQGADAARGLAMALDGLAELNAADDAEAVRETAIGLRAVGVQLALGALTLVGVSERLTTYAALRDFRDDDD
jgi:hypothetical protein